MKPCKNFMKFYAPKSMPLKMRKLCYKINMMTITNLFWNLLKVKRICINNLDINVSFNKQGLGFNSHDRKRSYKYFFIKETSQKDF